MSKKQKPKQCATTYIMPKVLAMEILGKINCVCIQCEVVACAAQGITDL